MSPQMSCLQQRLLLQLASVSWRTRPQPQMRSRIPNIILQNRPSPQWLLLGQRHTFSTTPRSSQQALPPSQDHRTPFPTYFQDPPAHQTAPLPPSPPPSSQPPPPPKRRLLRRAFFAVSFFLFGNLAGGVLERFVNPEPPLHVPSTVDSLHRERIARKAAQLAVVQALENDPNWASWDAYESFPEEHRRRHMISRALFGSGAVAYQRVFQHIISGEVLVVVYFGRALTGWPTVVHGGALATILDETLGRAAFAKLGGGQSAPGTNGREGPIVTAFLSLEYIAMTPEKDFYLVGARVRKEEELDPKEWGKGHYKAYVEGWVENARTGQETVLAEALFVRPKPKKGTVAAVEDEKAAALPPDKRW